MNILEKKFSELNEEQRVYVETYTAIVAKIQKELDRENMNYFAFAKRTTLHRSNINRILEMESSPRLTTLLKLTHGLGIKLEIKEK